MEGVREHHGAKRGAVVVTVGLPRSSIMMLETWVGPEKAAMGMGPRLTVAP